jgi:hypothetical protein
MKNITIYSAEYIFFKEIICQDIQITGMAGIMDAVLTSI